MMQKTQQDFLAIVESLSTQQRTQLAEKLAKLNPARSLTSSAKLVACVTTLDSKYPNLDSLREHLKGKLPDYFVPQTFIPVTELPRTAIGKIDRKNIQYYQWRQLEVPNQEAESWDDGEDFFGNSMDYAAPSSDYEKLLAGIWCEVLGIQDISVHDNFVEVGGDSLLSIRILARINKAGLSIAPEDFFEFPTISQQAMCLEQSQTNSVEQGIAGGILDLIPIQKWFFGRIQNAPQQWNQNCLLSTNACLDYVSLERTIQKLMLQHDVLRSTFINVDGIIKQQIVPFDGNIPLKFIDLSDLSDSELTATIVSESKLLNRCFKLDTSPLIQFLFVQTSAENENRLLITLHHLLADAQSWHILLDDLSNCWEAMSNDLDFKLSPKSTSFRLWSEKLHQYAESSELKSELDFWRQQSNNKYTSLPVDFENPREQNIEQSTKTIELLSDLKNESLIAFCNNNNTDIQTLLIAALVSTLTSYADTDSILLDVEGHGREALFEKIDVSRTIGWFTTVFPVAFNNIPGSLDSTFFHSIKSIIKAIPSKGIGHGVLRELANERVLKNAQLAEVCFNYLGRDSDGGSQKNSLAMLSKEKMNIGEPRSPIASRAFLFEINCAIVAGSLTVQWTFSSKFHKSATVEQLVKDYVGNIEQLIELDILTDPSEDTEAQFDLADLDDADLDNISNLLNDLDDD